MEKPDKTGLYILGVVAIVAIVGLVFLFTKSAVPTTKETATESVYDEEGSIVGNAVFPMKTATVKSLPAKICTTRQVPATAEGIDPTDHREFDSSLGHSRLWFTVSVKNKEIFMVKYKTTVGVMIHNYSPYEYTSEVKEIPPGETYIFSFPLPYSEEEQGFYTKTWDIYKFVKVC